MILSCVSFLCNLVRAAALPAAPLANREDYGVWREAAEADKWLPHCLRYACMQSQLSRCSNCQ